jgi:hypothetical protein
VGAYLQGSFAVGDFHDASDVDVLVAIDRDINDDQAQELQTLHGGLFDELPAAWGHRIELSYAPVSILRRWSTTPRDPPGTPRPADWSDPGTSLPPRAYPFWYLNCGARELVRSEHDNTRVVRWVTREKGITLAGPEPRTLIDPVSSDDLAIEIRDMLRLLNDRWANHQVINVCWLQMFFVTLCARVLHTLETGTVTSKQAATEWAAAHLDRRWRTLIETAWAEWRERRHMLNGPADPIATQETIALIRHALDVAERRSAGNT